MIVIADNLNTRNRVYTEALKFRDERKIAGLARELSSADIINIQCSLDGSGDEENLPWVAEIVARETGKDISLDSRDADALKGALPFCKRPPVINYISGTEPEEPDQMLELAAGSGASLVLRASAVTPPATLEAKLQIIEELIELANSFDIPNERLYADPSLVHIGKGAGQSHLANSAGVLRVLKELVEPPIKTVAWISNVSVGLPPALRRPVEAAYLSYLAGAGLDAAMLDALDNTHKRAVYLIKSFRDEIVFSPADLT